jgi:hypothetical protein
MPIYKKSENNKMPKIQTSCPRCKTPVVAEVEQLFDMFSDPQAKQRLLSGQANIINCPSCGYNGMLGSPIVYHDPDKEFLFTFVPPELGLPVNEQERMIGPLINQVVNRLPAEKRKAYLLRPQTMLTFQTMIERILEGDGISREMLEEQQKRLSLLQRLLSTSQTDARIEIIKQEEALIDQNFFAMLSHLIESTMAQNDERGTRVLGAVQQELLENTTVGKEIQEQSREAQEAVRSLQEAGQKGLTRESLLDLLIAAADNEVRFTTLVSLARNGFDYQFFQLLTDRVDAAAGEDKTRLERMRQTLLEYTQKIDEQVKQHIEESRKLLNNILSAPDVENALQENLEEIDDYFVEVLQQELQTARNNADLERISKLSQINAVLEKASAPPPELAFIEQLLEMDNYDERMKSMQDKAEMITPEFVQMLTGIIQQSETQGQPAELVEKLKEMHRIALRVTMMNAMKG